MEYEIKEIPIAEIKIPKKRVSAGMDLSEMESLKASIQRFGVFSEPIVCEKDGKYILLAGKNRLEALKEMGRKTVRVKIFKGKLSNGILLHLAENFARGRISALEVYNYIKYIHEEQGLDLKEIAKVTGMSESKLRTALKIGNLPDEVKEALITGQINEAVALQIARLKDPNEQLEVLRRAIEFNMTGTELQKYLDRAYFHLCDVCKKQVDHLEILFPNTPKEIWVCKECMEKQFPKIAKIKQLTEERLKEMLESGEAFKSIAEQTLHCEVCDQNKPAIQFANVFICRSCNAKLLRLMDQIKASINKDLGDLTLEEIDRLLIKL